jgi:hypothetical protein
MFSYRPKSPAADLVAEMLSEKKPEATKELPPSAENAAISALIEAIHSKNFEQASASLKDFLEISKNYGEGSETPSPASDSEEG